MFRLRSSQGRNVAQAVEHSALKVWILLYGGLIPFAVWAIFRSNQWSTTGPSKAAVCAVMSVGKCI